MSFEDLIGAVNGYVWSLPLVGLCLLAGLYFSLRTAFLQVRCIPDMLSQLKRGEKSADGTSSLQSLMMSLAGRVGIGNIGGVATAILASAGRRHSVADPSLSSDCAPSWKSVHKNHMLRKRTTSSGEACVRGV